MHRKENQALIDRCTAIIFRDASYEQLCAIRSYGLLVVDQDAEIPDYAQTAFCASIAFLLAEVYEDTLKWMDRTERGLIEDQIAFAVWMKSWHDMRKASQR